MYIYRRLAYARRTVHKKWKDEQAKSLSMVLMLSSFFTLHILLSFYDEFHFFYYFTIVFGGAAQSRTHVQSSYTSSDERKQFKELLSALYHFDRNIYFQVFRSLCPSSVYFDVLLFSECCH